MWLCVGIIVQTAKMGFAELKFPVENYFDYEDIATEMDGIMWKTSDILTGLLATHSNADEFMIAGKQAMVKHLQAAVDEIVGRIKIWKGEVARRAQGAQLSAGLQFMTSKMNALVEAYLHEIEQYLTEKYSPGFIFSEPTCIGIQMVRECFEHNSNILIHNLIKKISLTVAYLSAVSHELESIGH